MKGIETYSDDQILQEFERRGMDVKHLLEIDKEIRHLSLKLREAERSKSEFLSNVRNEINNPLTSILGLSDNITKLSSDLQIKKISGLIHLEALDLDYQMRNIIKAAEIESGDLGLTPSRVDVFTLLEEILQYLHPRVVVSGVIVVNRTLQPISFYTDPSLVQAIAINLIANAIEFSKHGDNVYVKAYTEDNTLIVQVSDVGIGIAKDSLLSAFDRFKQGDSGPRKLHRGQGLGLSIVSELVNLLGGKLTIDSSPGQGTCIHIRLPELIVLSSNQHTSQFGNDVLF